MLDQLIREITSFLRGLERCHLLEIRSLMIMLTPKSPELPTALEPLFNAIFLAIRECRSRLDELLVEKPTEIRNVITRLVRTKGEEKQYDQDLFTLNKDVDIDDPLLSSSNCDTTAINQKSDKLFTELEETFNDSESAPLIGPRPVLACPGDCENVCGDSLTVILPETDQIHFERESSEVVEYVLFNPVSTLKSISALAIKTDEPQGKGTSSNCRPTKSISKLPSAPLDNPKPLPLEKIHRCTHCGRGFVRASKLTRHMAIHAPATHVCGECGKLFPRADSLKRHVDIAHRKIRSFQCAHCLRYFSVKSNLEEHCISIHCGTENGKTCPMCGKSLKNGATFRGHLRTHQPPQFFCILCNRSFTRRPYYKRHMAKMHSGAKAIQNLLDAAVKMSDDWLGGMIVSTTPHSPQKNSTTTVLKNSQETQEKPNIELSNNSTLHSTQENMTNNIFNKSTQCSVQENLTSNLINRSRQISSQEKSNIDFLNIPTQCSPQKNSTNDFINDTVQCSTQENSTHDFINDTVQCSTQENSTNNFINNTVQRLKESASDSQSYPISKGSDDIDTYNCEWFNNFLMENVFPENILETCEKSPPVESEMNMDNDNQQTNILNLDNDKEVLDMWYSNGCNKSDQHLQTFRYKFKFRTCPAYNFVGCLRGRIWKSSFNKNFNEWIRKKEGKTKTTDQRNCSVKKLRLTLKRVIKKEKIKKEEDVNNNIIKTPEMENHLKKIKEEFAFWKFQRQCNYKKWPKRVVDLMKSYDVVVSHFKPMMTIMHRLTCANNLIFWTMFSMATKGRLEVDTTVDPEWRRGCHKKKQYLYYKIVKSLKTGKEKLLVKTSPFE